jgi:hypothetical protein
MPPTDDPSIADETKLHRGVASQHVVPDQNQDRLRPSSAAFNHEEMSVVLDDRLAASGRTPREALDGLPQEFLASLRCGFVRQHAQIVVRSPTETEPAHGDVIGRKTKPIKRAFARTAEWEVPPPVDFELPGGRR